MRTEYARYWVKRVQLEIQLVLGIENIDTLDWYLVYGICLISRVVPGESGKDIRR